MTAGPCFTTLRSATGITEVVALELLPGVGSTTLPGKLIDAVLVIEGGADPLIAPETVKVTLPPAGIKGIDALTLLPVTPTVDGHWAEPTVTAHDAVTPVTPTGTLSIKEAQIGRAHV